MAAELNDVIQLLWVRGEVQRREDLGDEGTHGREGERRSAGVPTFLLQEGVGHGGERDVPVPARIAAALEVIEAEFVLQLLVLLLDRPSLVRDPDQTCQGGRGGTMT